MKEGGTIKNTGILLLVAALIFAISSVGSWAIN